MPSQRVLFTSDLHARRELYAELGRWVESVRPAVLLLGGDLFAGDPKAQCAFARGPFLEAVSRWRDAGVTSIGVLPGNDDWAAAFEALLAAAPAGALHDLAREPLELDGGVNVIGYPFVPLSPFSLKDHEKLDRFQPDKQDVVDGVATGVGSVNGAFGVVTKPTDGSESIAADLQALEAQVRPGRTLFVAHCPPRNTRLDLVFGRHAGSQALREFLQRACPLLSLHGHLPEVEQRGGVFAEWVGETLAVNPGQGRVLHAVHFAADRPHETLVHTVLGAWVATGAASPANDLAT
jgi:Icc-related predicted phosphoesterase